MIDLRSDTVTRPTPEMYLAICSAPLGDDLLGDDPTVIRLQEMAAERLGKEAALFVPSGMMGNILAVKVSARPGDTVVCERRAHLYVTGCIATASANPAVMTGDRYGRLDFGELALALKPDSHSDLASLLCLENSFNGAGGTALPAAYIAGAADLAHARGVPVHLDGARLFNAAVALGVEAAELAKPVDTIMFCISKGLSSPVGSLLCGPRDLIEKAHRLRYMQGGAMRQAGILAACGIVSLERMVDRLAEDHANARLLAEGLAQIEGITVDLDVVQTNLVYFETAGAGIAAATLESRLEQQGVSVIAVGPTTVRVVTHKDVSRQDCVAALEIITRTLDELR